MYDLRLVSLTITDNRAAISGSHSQSMNGHQHGENADFSVPCSTEGEQAERLLARLRIIAELWDLEVAASNFIASSLCLHIYDSFLWSSWSQNVNGLLAESANQPSFAVGFEVTFPESDPLIIWDPFIP